MISLTLLIAVIAACAVARPPGDIRSEPIHVVFSSSRYPRFHDVLEPYPVPHFVEATFPIFVDRSLIVTPIAQQQQRPDYDWLSKEIDRLSLSSYEDEPSLGDVPHDGELPIAADTFGPSLILDDTPPIDIPANYQPNEDISTNYLAYEPLPQNEFSVNYGRNNIPVQYPEREIPREYLHDERMPVLNEPATLSDHDKLLENDKPMIMSKKQERINTNQSKSQSEELKKTFALTPHDGGFFDGREINAKPNASENTAPIAMKYQAGQQLHNHPGVVFEERRQTRQNPLYSKNRNLYAGDLETLKSGVASKNRQLTMSLVPTNLHFLRKSPISDGYNDQSTHDGDNLYPIPLKSGGDNPTESFYWVTFMAIVGGVFTFAVFGFAFGWYLMMSKKAKAAADVDYPGYGVTGPSVDLTGDRKLAHLAHMYHYQHQKQQIIAMTGPERNGSMSDPESEEENEEGDYTVYECPGFASTGNVEVKNPMFAGEPTPITPIKMEIVKPQPKD